MKKSRIVYLIGLLLPVLLATRSAFADVAADLSQAEGLYKAGQYARAEQVYINILQREPNNAEVVYQAAKMLPRIYLATDQLPKAQEAVLQLLVGSAHHERLPHAVHEIVQQAEASGKTVQVGQVYQNILATQPEHPQAIWLKMGIAVANAHLGNDQTVDSILQNIIAQHAADERAAEALGQTAWAYRKLGQPAKARKVYQYVVDNWPSKDRAIFSQRGIILCSLEIRDQDAADKATEALLQKFSKDKNMTVVALLIAQTYCNSKRDWPRTRALCHYILSNCPQAEDAIWAQQTLVLTSIGEKDPNGIQAGIQTLLARFSSDQKIPLAIYGIARKLNGYDDKKTAELYQYIIEKHPNHESVPLAKANLGQIKIRQGDEQAAETIFQKIITDYANRPQLAEAVHVMAEGYYLQAFRAGRAESGASHDLSDYTKAYIRKAMAKWDMITTQLPVHPRVTAESYYYAAVAHHQLCEYNEALQDCMQISTQWPGYENAWRAHLLAAKIYKQQMRDGTVSEADGLDLITQAYRQLSQRYPACPAARNAGKWLGQYGKSNQGGAQ